jgi:uncharacterized alpha-E superfamily protein
MLSRTADHLFWLARYTERADNAVRLLGLNLQNDLLRRRGYDSARAWRAVLGISELDAAYRAKHQAYAPGAVLEFMVADLENPSSIASCLQAARFNGRAVRGVLSTQVWETQNSTWLELQRMLKKDAVRREPARLFEWVKYRSHLLRGTMIDTMLRDEALDFTRLGTFLERADNTARLLDVKLFEADSPAREPISDDPLNPDFYHWAAVLHAVSGFEMYRKAYRDSITRERVAEFLILDEAMPRSLAHCLDFIIRLLQRIRNAESQETQRRAGRLHASLKYGRMEDILETGLHAWLTRFLADINHLGIRISGDFLTPARSESP